VYLQYSIKEHFPTSVASRGWICQHFTKRIIPTQYGNKSINLGTNCQSLMFCVSNHVKVKWPCSYGIQGLVWSSGLFVIVNIVKAAGLFKMLVTLCALVKY
jgi:hypothetical protein